MISDDIDLRKTFSTTTSWNIFEAIDKFPANIANSNFNCKCKIGLFHCLSCVV